MACILPNPRRMGYIDPIHEPLDEPLYMGSIYSQHNAIDWLTILLSNVPVDIYLFSIFFCSAQAEDYAL